jgi:hypothetical protein
MHGDWPGSRAYIIGSILNWLLFLSLVALLAWGGERIPYWGRVGIVVAMAGTVAVQFIAAYRSVAREDEFVRGIAFKCGIAAIGVTLTTAVLYGLGQQFLGLPEVPMWVAYPFFWGAFGLVSPFIRTSRT